MHVWLWLSPPLAFCRRVKEGGPLTNTVTHRGKKNYWVPDICVCLPSLHAPSPSHWQMKCFKLNPVSSSDTSKLDYYVILMIRPTAAISQHVPTIRHAHTLGLLWRLFMACNESKVHTVWTAVHKNDHTHICDTAMHNHFINKQTDMNKWIDR